MAPARPRLVRRAPLTERIQAWLNPADWLIWLSEELNGGDWEEFIEQWAATIGVLLNIVFMVACANSISEDPGDDVFGDYFERRGSGWLAWLATITAHTLAILSCVNAAYTGMRERHYRLFEHSVDIAPSTPSARRVKVSSSPSSFASSPIRQATRFIASTLSSDASAASRAHPDPTKDVWEVAVWDPSPLCLSLFTYFSPGHVLVYYLFLPVRPIDPQPSVTVFTTIVLAGILTAQLVLMKSFFQAQARDNSLINRQVHTEYDAKFVKPNLNRPVRDVGTQLSFTSTGTPVSGDRYRGTPEVQTYTPRINVHQGFQTHPNTNYEALYDPDSTPSRAHGAGQGLSRAATESALYTPIAAAAAARAHRPAVRMSSDFSSPLKSPPLFAGRGEASLVNRGTPASNHLQHAGTGDGGSFGIYSHAQSPLKRTNTAVNGLARAQSPEKGRQGGRRSMADGTSSSALGNRYAQLRGTGAEPDRHRRQTGMY